MENVLSVIKFVLACILAAVSITLTSLRYVMSYCGIVIGRAILALSPDVRKMVADLENNMLHAYIVFVFKM